ncbi:UNVERIFIED_CONTAM: hypothetical protein Slati_4295100 [Sesamum latifolium]|uniref:Uncharacterized protein n=1 Tax=Sesamum latifolium TaxID=2727402 RepID=A0AAW2TEC0_9LAMI
MNPLNVPPPADPYFQPQSRYFYTYRWTKKYDKAFVRAIYFQARCGHKQLNRTPNMHSLMYARDVVNNGFGWPFKYHVIKKDWAVCDLDTIL